MHNIVFPWLCFSTCFGHFCAHPQEDLCIFTTSGSLLVSVWWPCGFQPHGHQTETNIEPDVNMQRSSWGWAQKCPKHVEEHSHGNKILCIKLEPEVNHDISPFIGTINMHTYRLWTVRVTNPCGARFSAPGKTNRGSIQAPVQWVVGLFPGG